MTGVQPSQLQFTNGNLQLLKNFIFMVQPEPFDAQPLDVCWLVLKHIYCVE